MSQTVKGPILAVPCNITNSVLASKQMNDFEYVLGLDPSSCHTGWAMHSQVENTLTYGVFEPPKGMTDDLDRMDFMMGSLSTLLYPDLNRPIRKVAVFIEGLAFNGRGQDALQLAGLGFMLRRELRHLQIPFTDVAPTQAKKFLTGKGKSQKDLILKEVFKRYRNDNGTPIDLEDNNIADAVNFCMIGKTYLGWRTADNLIQSSIINDLKSPKVKKTRKAA